MILAYGEGWCQYYAGVRTEAFVLAGRGRPVLFTREWGLKTSARVSRDNPVDYLKKRGVKEVGMVAESIPLRAYEKLSREKGIKVYDATRKAWEKRTRKTGEEVKKIRRAARWTSRVFEEVLPEIGPGMTEKQAGAMLAGRLLEKAEALSFPTIVASGPNSEHVHVYPTDRKLRRGDLVIIDAGVIMQGYCSDMTRTILLGNDKKKKELIQACADAHRAFKEANPATVQGIVRAISRSLGEKKKFARYAYGHGLGADVHEPPVIREKEKARIRKGTVLAIEPGLHVRGLGGARIEDDYYYDGKKWERMTRCCMTL